MPFLFSNRFLITSSLLLARSFSSSSFIMNVNTVSTAQVSFLDARTAQMIDERLMNQHGFSIDQLMELAGYSVASAVHDMYVERYGKENPSDFRRLLIFCGPGNNGGDGLVAARHLKHFGYSPSIVYPKQGKSNLFMNLVKQCIDVEIEVLSELPSLEDANKANLIVDGLFGFSFQGPVRSPYDSLIKVLKDTKTPVLSIDLPSGWDVNDGDIHQPGFLPDAVISLTLPKNCLRNYGKIHYLGGRFVPPALSRELGLRIPSYGYGGQQILKLVASEDQPCITASEPVVMYTSAPTLEEAKQIGNTLIRSKLAACVNIIPNIVSVFEWEDKVDNSNEVLLMIKTRQELAASVTETIKKIHSYDLPESIALKIQKEGSNPEFLNWIVDSTQPKEKLK